MNRIVKLIMLFVFVSSINLAQTNTFNGSTDNSWHKACNWSLNTIPTCAMTVTIPTGLVVDVTNVAHCNILNIQGTADVNISGSGQLEVSSTTGTTCAGTATDLGGCSVPSSSWSINGSTQMFGCFNKYCICPCPNTGPDNRSLSWTNNTTANITINLPTVSCASWFPSDPLTITAGSTVTVTLASTSCCPPNFTFTGVPWTASDGGSGTFSIEVCNVL